MRIDVRGKPRPSRVIPGSIFSLTPKKTGPKMFSQTASRYTDFVRIYIKIENGRETALELVSGADFLCELMRGAGPVDLRGSRGPHGRPDPEADRFSAISQSPLCLNPREMALELVSGADFLCELMCGAGPVDLRGSRGPRGRPDPENDRFSAKSPPPPLPPHPS